jgi:hypothetical protein
VSASVSLAVIAFDGLTHGSGGKSIERERASSAQAQAN